LNDDISPQVTALILRRVARDHIRDGEPLIVAVPETDGHLFGIEEKIIAAVKARCRLTLVETRKFNSIFRMSDCAPPAPP
jgi:hypothetical protein